MRENPFLQDRVRQATHHGNLKHRHQLTAFNAEDSAAQYLFRFDVNHGFHEAASLAHLNGPRDVAHWQLRHSKIDALIPSFCFSDPDSPELRIYKDGVRN